MPRTMPRLDLVLIKDGKAAIELARAGEIVRSTSIAGTPAWNEWPVSRLEALYELAFLRVFIQWEMFLEETFYRYLCGYASRYGQATLAGAASYYRTISAAEVSVLAGQPYIAWYNVATVEKRCKKHIKNGLHEKVFASSLARLRDFSAVRHRIAHGQKDAKAKFDAATMSLAKRVYPASRPGRFLRDWDSSRSPPVRWLESIVTDFGNLAGQIV
jgi:hypothetical protein